MQFTMEDHHDYEHVSGSDSDFNSNSGSSLLLMRLIGQGMGSSW